MRPAVAGDERLVAGGEQVQGQVGLVLDQVQEVAGDQLVGLEVEVVHAPLGGTGHLVEVGLGPLLGGVEGDDAGVVVVGAVDRARAQAEHQAHDPGLGVDGAVPDVGVEGEADAGHLRIEVPVVHGARDAHDQQRHLLVAVQHAAVGAVAQGLLAHGAGVDGADGGQQVLEALLARALVGAEDALVLAGEGVAVVVLQQGAGAHDEGRLAEVVDHLLEAA